MFKIDRYILKGSAILILFTLRPALAQILVTKRTIDANSNSAYWVYAYDINSDGRVDLVSGSGSQGLRWYRNNNNDTFSRNDIDNNFFGVWTVTAYDIDGDGDVDIVASSPAQDVVAWWEKASNGAFVKHVVDNITQDPETNFATDLDGDGDGDILVGGWESDELVWIENQDSIFVRHVVDAAFNNAHSVYAADLTNDGQLDILGIGSAKTSFWVNNGNGTFSRRTLDNVGGWSLFPIDLDKDGDVDVVRSNRNTRGIDWFRNKGTGSFSSAINIDTEFAPRMSPSPDTTEIWSVAGGDIDGDGDNDVVAAIYPKFDRGSNGYVYAWLNDGNQNFTEFVVDSLVADPRSVTVADFDGDGDADIAVAYGKGVIWYETQIDNSPTITLNQPNGGENLESGSSYAIQWSTTGSITNVKLEYSVNNGAVWSVITASTPNDGSHSWTVPDASTNSALVRVSESATGIPSDVSNSPFSIFRPSLTILSPNGGQAWSGGENHTITWSSVGSIPAVKLEYSTDGGSNWSSIIASTPNNGSYTWFVPDVSSGNALVRISDAADGQPADVSDAVFTIEGSSLTLTSPNGGEAWSGGENYTITWSSVGPISALKLEYSLDGGSNWSSIIASTPNNGSYTWFVPDVSSGNALVRISDAADGQPADVSDTVFSIVGSSLTLTAPNGGESWMGGMNHDITWNATGPISAVKLEYSVDGGSNWSSIIASTPNNGSYTWFVPDVSSGNALVRISDAADGQPADVSDAVFTIEGSSLALTSPNGGENWAGGENHTITWQSTGLIQDVKLEYSANGGTNWAVIVDNAPNNGGFDWSVPKVTSDSVLVRISDAADGVPLDVSDALFSIHVAVTSTGEPHDDARPTEFELFQNYPNPFNAETQIRFALPRAAETHVAVYDVTGKLIKHLFDGELNSGFHTFAVNDRDEQNREMPSGVYIYTIRAGDWHASRKLTLVK